MSLAERMKNRPPNPEAWNRAFGATKGVDGGQEEQTFVVAEAVRLLRESKDALLFRIGEHDVWVPRSQIVSSSETTLIVTMWLARERQWV